MGSVSLPRHEQPRDVIMGKGHKAKKRERIETSPSLHAHPTRDELIAIGTSLRDKCPRQSHAVWQAPHDHVSPVQLIQDSNQGRLPHTGRFPHRPIA